MRVGIICSMILERCRDHDPMARDFLRSLIFHERIIPVGTIFLTMMEIARGSLRSSCAMAGFHPLAARFPGRSPGVRERNGDDAVGGTIHKDLPRDHLFSGSSLRTSGINQGVGSKERSLALSLEDAVQPA
jgi:hypothetical protein